MPHKFLMHASGDAVGVAVEEIRAGEHVTGMVLSDRSFYEVTALDPIPLGHKEALRAIAGGERVIEYGEVIGETLADVSPGQHVHVHNLRSVRWPTSTAAAARIA